MSPNDQVGAAMDVRLPEGGRIPEIWRGRRGNITMKCLNVFRDMSLFFCFLLFLPSRRTKAHEIKLVIYRKHFKFASSPSWISLPLFFSVLALHWRWHTSIL